MREFNIRLFFSVSVFWLSTSLFGRAAETVQTTPPNIVLIISDDQSWTDYGFMGHPQIKTPNIDRLAAESLTFTRGYVPSSLCRPSLASMITGLYPHQHRIVGNDPAMVPGDEKRQSPEYRQLREDLISHIDKVPTLPSLLAQKGYVSHQSGKWWEGNFKRGRFTAGMTRGFPEPGGRHGDDGLKIGREGLKPVTDFMRQAKQDDKPFFIWYAPFLPHTPHNPPERLLNKYRPLVDSLPIAKYWAMCEWFDETCGDLLNYIDNNGLKENTVVLYVTDNGWINQRDKSAYAPRSKRSPFDGGLRTPIMIRYPDHVSPKRDDQVLANSIDLAPTILNLCGLKPTKEMLGIDLLDQTTRESRNEIYGEVFEHDIQDVQRPIASLRYRWIIRDNWKLIQPNPQRVTDDVMLFNIMDDPMEKTNVAARQTDRLKELQASLDPWWNK